MGTEFRTVLILDEKCHEVDHEMLVFVFNGNATPAPFVGQSPINIPIPPDRRSQWLESLHKAPIGFVVKHKKKTHVFGKVEINATSGDGVEVTGEMLEEPTKVFLFHQYTNGSGTPRCGNHHGYPVLTIGATIRVNRIMRSLGFDSVFSDEYAVQVKLPEDHDESQTA